MRSTPKMTLTVRPLMLALAMSTLSVGAWAQSLAIPVPLPIAQAQASETAGAAGRENGWHQKRMEKRKHAHMERQARALESLARDLQLQPGQQAAWQRFEQAMKTRPAPVSASTAETVAALNLPDQVARLKARKAERDAALEQRLQAALDLHSSLDKTQQQVLDERAGRWLQRQWSEHGGRHGMGARHGRDHGQRQGHMHGHSHAPERSQHTVEQKHRHPA